MIWPFENDTSAIIKKLANRSMKADKRRNIFVLVTIALTVCLMGTLCFVYSSRQMQTIEHIQGQYQAGCEGLRYEEIECLVAAGKFEKWGYTAGSSSIRYKYSNLSISFVDPGMIDLMGYGKITGSYPQTEYELCVERSFLDYYKLPDQIGQTITLDLGRGEHPYTITGILESISDNTSQLFTLWISAQEALSNGNPKPYELRFRFAGSQLAEPERLKLDIAAFFREMGVPKEQTFYSSNYFDAAELALGSGIEIYALAILLALICAIVIYNIFYISVMGKMREYGQLKVLGATPKQLKQVVKRERRILTAVAIPLGLLLAAAVTSAVIPGYWSWRDNLVYTVVISLMTYLVIRIATKTPLKLVGSVSAIQSIRVTAYSEYQGRGFSRQLHRRLTMPKLAWMNFTRNRKKAILTALSLSLTGILLNCIATYANSVDAKEIALASFGDGSNYLLAQQENAFGPFFVETQTENPLGKDLQDHLSALPGVDYITTYSSTSVEIPQIMENEPFDILGLTKEQMSILFEDKAVLNGVADYQQLIDENGILVAPCGSTLKTIYDAEFHVGDTISLHGYNKKSKTYTIMGIVEEVHVGSAQFFILPEEELHYLYPEITDFTSYLNIHAKRDNDQLRRAVYDAVTDTRIHVVALGDIISNIKTSLRGELTMFYGILAFIFVFSLINLANTLITNLLSRQQELGIFQSVGMSRKQLSKMLSLECLLYAGVALLSTLTLGTICSMIVCKVFDQIGIFGKITYHFPVLEMLLFTAALLLVHGTFSFGATHYSQKLSLVERIKMID